MFESIVVFFKLHGAVLLEGTGATIVMTTVSTVIAYLIGIPLAVGVKLCAEGEQGAQEDEGGSRTLRFKAASLVLGWIIDVGRSIPFIILMVILIPFTRLLVGTSLGVAGAIVPLTIGAIPFVARLVENSLSEVPPGCIEAAQAFGANTFQIVMKVYLKESLPSLIRGAAITYIALVGYSAIAGAIGAGGLGDIAIRFGYYRYQDDVLLVTLVIIIVLVALVQGIGSLIARKIDKR
ncbi:MAG: ABC transporter permease [Coriobacteriales bacterium]|jgi:D-methionine transport system permease protein|nr:ABC transporter permease [Coriobacteriales bacterium]